MIDRWRSRLGWAGAWDGASGHQRSQSQRPAGAEGSTPAAVTQQTEGEPQREAKCFPGQPGHGSQVTGHRSPSPKPASATISKLFAFRDTVVFLHTRTHNLTVAVSPSPLSVLYRRPPQSWVSREETWGELRRLGFTPLSGDVCKLYFV